MFRFYLVFSDTVLVARNHGAQTTGTLQQEKEEEGKEREEIGKEGRKKEKEVTLTRTYNSVQ